MAQLLPHADEMVINHLSFILEFMANFAVQINYSGFRGSILICSADAARKNAIVL